MQPQSRPSVPDPSHEARAHSAVLAQRIRDAVERAGGWISFSQYMDMALYEPGLGYYAGGSAKFGGAGDFVTAPEISPLFAAALANQAAEILAATGGDVLELGPGTGNLAAGLLRTLHCLGRLPRRYLMLEVSAELRARQAARVAKEIPHLQERIVWLDALPEQFDGLILANEVLDAVPVHVVAWEDSGVRECGVSWRDGWFAWLRQPIDDGRLRSLASMLPPDPPYVSEIGVHAAALVATLAARLVRGALLFIDYGFGRDEYYHPQRSTGTLMCHHRHHAHTDPFHLPGLQDITAHIDFTAVADAAGGEGLTLAGYTTQAHFLVNCGITDLLGRIPADRPLDYLPRAAEVQKLLSPAEMGELFKVIAFTRGIQHPLRGFARGNLERLLE